jgi:hypothetical protein
MIDLPLGATEDRVCGTIDIEKALTEGVKAFEPGLLASFENLYRIARCFKSKIVCTKRFKNVTLDYDFELRYHKFVLS